MSINFRFISMAIAFMLCFSTVAFGQGLYGSIEGTVVDSNNAAIPNATVTVRSTGSTTGFNSTITASADGGFIFPRIAPGTYEITVKAANFKDKTIPATVIVDKTTKITATLEPGTGPIQVDVTIDAAVTIDNTDTKIDTNITKEVFDALPKGTNFTTLLKTAPNVRPEARAGGFQIDGASGSENVFVIDGQEVTNFRTGTLNFNNNLPFELLQEVQIKSTGFEAEYGGATGGVINVVTGGGNNDWRGNFAISFRPSKLQGNPRPILNRFDTSNSTAIRGFEYFQPTKDGGTDFFPVANFSGPVIKDKLWFSATYSPQFYHTTRVIDYYGSSNPANRITPTETIEYKATSVQEYAFFRLDAQPTSRLRMFGTFLWNPLINKGLLPGLTEGFGAPQAVNFGGSIGTLRGADLLSRRGGRDNANSFNGQVTWNPLNWMVLNFRGGRSFLNEKGTAYFVPQVTRYICSNVAVVTPAQTGCVQGFQNVSSNSGINFDVSTRTTFDADATFVGINFAGRHNIKAGYQYNRLFNTVDRGYQRLGIIQLFYGFGLDSFIATPAPSGPICAVGQTTGCVLGTGVMTRFGTFGEASSDNTALFVQDSWQIANRLTLNVGVRIENEVVPNFGTTGSQAIKFGWGDKIAPRFGVAFDLTGKGKTKVFASYGWFYDRFKYELPRGSFGGDFFRRDYFELTPARGYLYTSYTLANVLGNFNDPIGGRCPITGITGYTVCQFDFRIATNLTGADIFETGAVDPNIKAARQSEYTFGIEHQLGKNFVIAGRFTHKQQDRAVEDVGVFNSQGSEAYIIGNPGFGLVCEIARSGNYPCPKAQRDYDAVEIRVDKRATRYFFNASYTWSRLFGNYSGLASSDEDGRTSPNVNRFFDLPPLGFNADGQPDNGRLATDRPHVFKAWGGYFFNWDSNGNNRTTVSAFTTIQSGVPLTTIYNLYSLGTTILFRRGDLGRTETFSETDLGISHRYRFGRDNRYTFEPYIDIRNLFDEKNVLSVQNSISTQNFNAATLRTGGCTTCGSASDPASVQEAAVFQTIFNRGGIQRFVLNFLQQRAGTSTGTRNDYKQPNSFQGPRSVRFGFRFFF